MCDFGVPCFPGKSVRPSARQYVLVATGAGWTSAHDLQLVRDKLLDHGVQIYAVGKISQGHSRPPPGDRGKALLH